MARCAVQFSSDACPGLTAGYFTKEEVNQGVKFQSLKPHPLSCYNPLRLAHSRFPHPALRLRTLHVVRRGGRRVRRTLRCSAQDEGGEIGGEPAPLEGWERDAAAARVAELAEKAGAAGKGRRKLSFKAITAAAEGVNKGGTNGDDDVANEKDVKGVGELSGEPAVKRRGFDGFGETGSGGSFRQLDADVSGEVFVRKPWLENQGLQSGGLRKRPERAPSGDSGLDGRKDPWVRQGFVPEAPVEGREYEQENKGFGFDNYQDVDRKAVRGRQAFVPDEQEDMGSRFDENRGVNQTGLEGKQGFARRKSFGEGNENSGFDDNRDVSRKAARGKQGAASRALEDENFGFDDNPVMDRRGLRRREERAGGKDERRSSRGSDRGASGGGWKESGGLWDDETREGRNSFETPVAKDVWHRNSKGGESVSDLGEAGVGFRPPAPKPVWRNRQGGEELLGTSAWAAKGRAETSGGKETGRGYENEASGGARNAGEDWADRPPRGRKGDPRGPLFRRDRMGMKALGDSDDSGWGARREARGRKSQERGQWGDINDDFRSGGESGFDDEGEGEIVSWAPRGTAKRFGARGRTSTGRGSSRRDDAVTRSYEPRARDNAGLRSFDSRDLGRSDGSTRDRSDGWGSQPDAIQRSSETRLPRSDSNRSFDANRASDGNDSFDGRPNNGNGFGGVEAKAPLTGEEQRERRKMKRVKLPGPGCYGCGARLQVSDPGGPGYLRPDVYELKRNHRQLEDTLCGRCNELVQGKMVPAVGGNGGHGSGGQGEGYVMAEELRDQLKPLKLNKVLVVKLVDIADFNGSFLSKVRDLVGANPIILVCTKVDLLPADTDLEAVADWVWDATVRKKLRSIAVHLISSLRGAGLPMLAANILRERQGRDVYVLGAANVGKSAFINALLAEMSTRDPAAAAARRKRPTESAMPGTTLGPIPINAFSGGGELFDTPGIHLHHRLASLLTPEELVMITPKKRFRPVVPALTSSASPPSGSAAKAPPPRFPPGEFVILRPHSDAPPEAVFVAQISPQGGTFTRVSGGVEEKRLPARPWVPKLTLRGANSDPWNDPWSRKWVPHAGGEFPLDPDDVIATWHSRAKNPEEGLPIPPMTAARAQEQLGGFVLPGGSYPPWVGIQGEILNAQEWGVKVAAGPGGKWERKKEDSGESEKSPPLVFGREEGGETQQEGVEGMTYFWGGVARVDVLKAPPGLRLSFYGPHTVALHAVATSQADEFYQANLFDTLTPPLENRGADWDGLPYKKECNLFSEDDVRPAGDVVVSGLGWFAVGGAPGKRGRRKAAATSTGEVRLVVHTPRGVEVYLRPPMPVTETGADWFERPAFDVELERPPIYFPRIGGVAKQGDARPSRVAAR